MNQEQLIEKVSKKFKVVIDDIPAGEFTYIAQRISSVL